MIRLKKQKDGTLVNLDNTHPAVFLILNKAALIWEAYGSPDLVVTGGNETGHSTGARGYHHLPDGTCQAVDLRTWTIKDFENRKLACQDLAHTLGSLYDIIFEEQITDPESGQILRGEHCHAQYDPIRPGTHL